MGSNEDKSEMLESGDPVFDDQDPRVEDIRLVTEAKIESTSWGYSSCARLIVGLLATSEGAQVLIAQLTRAAEFARGEGHFGDMIGIHLLFLALGFALLAFAALCLESWILPMAFFVCLGAIEIMDNVMARVRDGTPWAEAASPWETILLVVCVALAVYLFFVAAVRQPREQGPR